MFRLTNDKIEKSGLIEIFNAFEKDEKIYIFMEYAPGKSLRTLMNKSNYLSISEALYITKILLTTINSLHNSFEQKIIHRDLKPENIIISDNLTDIKIIDFGISTSLKKNNDDLNIGETNEKYIFGTYSYITPQILEAKGMKQEQKKDLIKRIGVQFDLYAIGVILFEMLMGEKPYITKDEQKLDVLQEARDYDIKSLSSIKTAIPVAVENIILRLMASKEHSSYDNDSDIIKSYAIRQSPVPMYKNCTEVINDINNVLALYEKNKPIPKEELLRPSLERNYQKSIQKIFNIKRNKLRFYET